MKHMIRLTDYSRKDIIEVFEIADELEKGGYQNFLKGKTIVMFFSNSSVRTRVTFERGIYLLGGQPILFPTETLDKKEDIQDVTGYLNNWTDACIVRHKEIGILDKIARHAAFPVINAMTDSNHPCEMLSDMYALSKIRSDFTKDTFLFVGSKGNIGSAWREASKTVGFRLKQCCPRGYEMEEVEIFHELKDALPDTDIVCTDSIPGKCLPDFAGYQITSHAMSLANKNAILNPCPPFYRGEEVSAEVINSKYFVGYGFKKYLIIIQQAVLIYCLTH